MSTELILHIGAGKTGTSSIQKFLGQNSERLAQEGILVPSHDMTPTGPVSGQHVWYFNSLRKYSIDDAREKLENDIRTNIAKAKFTPQKVLLSAENLSDRNEWQDLFVNLAKEYKITIVFYVRRQDEYLMSAWQQWYVKHDNDVWAWLLRVVGTLGNWQNIIEDWAQVVPKENFIIRPYERAQLLNQDVVSDFASLLNLTLEYLEKSSSAIKENTSFNLGVLKIAEGNKSLFENAHDNDFYNFLNKFTQNSGKISRQSFITHKQRMAILTQYAASNKWIVDNFINKETAPQPTLFKMPRPNDYVVMSNEEIEKQKFNVLLEAIYGFYKETKK